MGESVVMRAAYVPGAACVSTSTSTAQLSWANEGRSVVPHTSVTASSATGVSSTARSWPANSSPEASSVTESPTFTEEELESGTYTLAEACVTTAGPTAFSLMVPAKNHTMPATMRAAITPSVIHTGGLETLM